ncbi:YqaA family protein [Terriglobus aquaticus]|uniref:YqaA family protein n=1 Tax=Terriglobus aquaticus TaxID=940139 RepID=A0ABW9KQ49_9BACT|nr:VTT domain-containing protein [Terriglobus aquaticus]
MRSLPPIFSVLFAAAGKKHGLLGYFMRLGPLGLFLVSAIDSSPIPLPIPGSSDILVTLFAAQEHGWLLATVIATLGSAVGGFASYQTGKVGGMALMDRMVPKRFRTRMTHWSEEHAISSVAVPAILPPPAPLMPFLIAAGALRMPRRKFYPSFVISRFLRHAFFAWLGVHYGRAILPVYRRLADQYGWILLVVVWGSVIFAIVYAIVKLRQARGNRTAASAAPA